MTPITITVRQQCVEGYFYAAFAGIWVVHPASNGKAFSQIRGFAPEVQAAKVLRQLALRDPAVPPATADAFEWQPIDVPAQPPEHMRAEPALREEENAGLETARV